MSITLSALQRQRYDTAANWTAANPTLLAGELGIESDTEKFKIGDGSTAWNALAYLPGSEISAHPIVTADVADSAITSAKIADGTIVNADISASAEIAVSKLGNGTARQLLQTDAAGTGVEWTSNIDVQGTLDVTSAATFDNNVTIQGDLTVNGTTTTIDTTTLVVEDKNIEMGAVATPTDVTADGGGITLKGATDKTINWVDATDAWTFSEHVDLASAKEFRINGTKVLDATSLGSAVVSSSLTSVGTIGTGTWQGTAIDAAYLDATVVTTSDTGTVTSAMIADGTIVNADINASAAISDTKLDTISTAGKVSNSATTADSSNTASAIVARDASGDFTAGTITASLTGNADTATALSSTRTFEVTGDITGTVSSDLTSGASIATSIASGVIVDDDVNASAAIAGTKIDPDFGSQTVETTGVFSAAAGSNSAPSITFTGDLDTGFYSPGADEIGASVGGGEALRIDSSGRLLVGTSSARTGYSGNTPEVQVEAAKASDSVRFGLCNNSNGVQDSQILLAKTRGTSVGSNTVVQNGDTLGRILFLGADGTDLEAAAQILAQVDGTPGNNDMPGRLVFSTTADGASSPTERMKIDSTGAIFVGNSSSTFNVVANTNSAAALHLSGGGSGSANIEIHGSTHSSDPKTITFDTDSSERMRITNAGHLLVSKTGLNVAVAGMELRNNGLLVLTTNNGQECLILNRQDSDGVLIEFRQANSVEGSISVSGTTISYNGAHLSRWSQLSGNQEREEILRGSVLSNINEMCEWGEEDNEQLNRMKVSDIEGDKNVSGVFQAWDDDDDTYTNDFYCAMTGDFIIRIGAGVTVERGDLLMSAGDGTAKPQDDDIIRSKTIAKVTSTNVSCTYDDGSYCVPCVLMAC